MVECSELEQALYMSRLCKAACECNKYDETLKYYQWDEARRCFTCVKCGHQILAKEIVKMEDKAREKAVEIVRAQIKVQMMLSCDAIRQL